MAQLNAYFLIAIVLTISLANSSSIPNKPRHGTHWNRIGKSLDYLLDKSQENEQNQDLDNKLYENLLKLYQNEEINSNSKHRRDFRTF